VSVASRGYLLAVGGEVLAVAVLLALALVAFIHWFPPFDQWPCPFDRVKSKWLRYELFYAALVILSLTDYALWGGFQDLGDVDFGFLILFLMIGFALVASGVATMFALGARRERDHHSPRTEALRLLGVFVVLAMLSASLAAGGSLSRPKVRPAVVLMLDTSLHHTPPRVICGIYIGQTSDRVYIGRAVQKHLGSDLGDHEQGRLIELTRAHVGRLMIGTSVTLTKALKALPAMGKQIVEQVAVPRKVMPHCASRAATSPAKAK
jgi:hypothetical protein